MCKVAEERVQAKLIMQFWFLHFKSILILVSKLNLRLLQSLKMKNQVYFGPCRQLVTENTYMANEVHCWHVRH